MQTHRDPVLQSLRPRLFQGPGRVVHVSTIAALKAADSPLRDSRPCERQLREPSKQSSPSNFHSLPLVANPAFPQLSQPLALAHGLALSRYRLQHKRESLSHVQISAAEPRSLWMRRAAPVAGAHACQGLASCYAAMQKHVSLSVPG